MVLKVYRPVIAFTIIGFVLLASACGANPPAPTAAPALLTASPAPVLDTPTAQPPTPTPVPLAALVNGEGITLQEYQDELARFKAAVENAGTNMATVEEQIVLDDLVNQLLLAQGAAQAGFVVDELMVEERLEQLALEIGGEQVLAGWMAENGFTEESLARFLTRALAAAWMRDMIIDSVPTSADQAHIRQILLNDEETAQDVLDRLAAGRDFDELAYEFDPLMGGDLGWLPKGYLAETALDDAVFALEAGETSQVIETGLGFHILYVVEKGSQRPISPDARLVLQEQALQDWLDQRRSQGDIQLLLQ